MWNKSSPGSVEVGVKGVVLQEPRRSRRTGDGRHGTRRATGQFSSARGLRRHGRSRLHRRSSQGSLRFLHSRGGAGPVKPPMPQTPLPPAPPSPTQRWARSSRPWRRGKTPYKTHYASRVSAPPRTLYSAETRPVLGGQGLRLTRRPPSLRALRAEIRCGIGRSGLFRRSLYVSPSGYGLVCCGLCTQGGALPPPQARGKADPGLFSLAPSGRAAARRRAPFFNRPVLPCL
jgi:hypothetical protein